MRSLLIEGQLILKALQEDSQSDFDLLWSVLQSSEVQGYISETDLNRLFVDLAQSQGIDVAASMAHHLSNVLTVYAGEDPPDLDFLISTKSERWLQAANKLPMLSVSAYLQRLTLDLAYRDQLANSKNNRILTQWLRKFSDSGFDPFLAIPLALTALMQGLGLFDRLLGLDSDSEDPGDRPWYSPSIRFLAVHQDELPLSLDPGTSATEVEEFPELEMDKANSIDVNLVLPEAPFSRVSLSQKAISNTLDSARLETSLKLSDKVKLHPAQVQTLRLMQAHRFRYGRSPQPDIQTRASNQVKVQVRPDHESQVQRNRAQPNSQSKIVAPEISNSQAVPSVKQEEPKSQVALTEQEMFASPQDLVIVFTSDQDFVIDSSIQPTHSEASDDSLNPKTICPSERRPHQTINKNGSSPQQLTASVELKTKTLVIPLDATSVEEISAETVFPTLSGDRQLSVKGIQQLQRQTHLPSSIASDIQCQNGILQLDSAPLKIDGEK